MPETETPPLPRNGRGPAGRLLPPADSAPAREARPALSRPAAAPPDPSTPDPALDPAPPLHAAHDLITRNRSPRGDRLPSSYTFSVPTVEDRALLDKPLARAVAVIEERFPILGSELHDHHDHKLLPALRRFNEVRAEEERAVVDRDAYAQAKNAEIETRQNVLRGEREAATQTDRAELLALDGALAEAHGDAGRKVARTGGAYDPAAPDPACVLRHAPVPLETLAGRSNRPGPHADAHIHLANRLGWFLTIVTGGFIGLSLGLYTRLLHLRVLLQDGLFSREGALTLAWMIGGVAVAAGIKYGVRGLWYLVGQDYTLGAPTRKWRTTLTLAFGITLLLLLVDMATERQGLLAMAALQNATQALSGLLTRPSLLDVLIPWLIGLLITLGYLTCAGVEGYLKGRQEENVNQLRAMQETEFADRDREVRANTDTQAALAAISAVHDLHRRQEALQARIARTAAPFDEKIAKEEAQRLPERVPMNDEARKRVQDALDNFHGAQVVFDALLHEARTRCEAIPSLREYLLRLFLGLRPPRRWERDADRRG